MAADNRVGFYTGFCWIGTLPIKLWDESRMAIIAMEMSKSNNWWITTFDGQNDMWNTKPTLVHWIQALFIRVIGLRPLALRLPVAIAGFITVLVVFKFVQTHFKSNLLAFLAAIILVTNAGYLTEHVVRTGDFDGFLVLFTTLASFSFFNYLETSKAKQLYLFFIFLGLAVLSKSVAGLLFLPGMACYALARKQVLSILTSNIP